MAYKKPLYWIKHVVFEQYSIVLSIVFSKVKGLDFLYSGSLYSALYCTAIVNQFLVPYEKYLVLICHMGLTGGYEEHSTDKIVVNCQY